MQRLGTAEVYRFFRAANKFIDNFGTLLKKISWRGWTALSLAALVIGALLFARLIDQPDSKKDTKDTAHSETSPTPTLPYDGDAAAGHDIRPDPVKAPQEAINVAVAFVQAWATHPTNEPPDHWWQRVSVYADKELAEELRTTDPSRVPANKVTGEPQILTTSKTKTELSVPTNIGKIKVICTTTNNKWTVSDFDLSSKE